MMDTVKQLMEEALPALIDTFLEYSDISSDQVAQLFLWDVMIAV